MAVTIGGSAPPSAAQLTSPKYLIGDDSAHLVQKCTTTQPLSS